MNIEEFLKNIDVPVMSIQDFVISQISYIRTWVWCISFIIFIVSLFWAVFLPDTVLWLILVVLILIESWNTAVVSIAKIFYIVTPFLLTSFIGLLVVRKIRGQEGMYAWCKWCR